MKHYFLSYFSRTALILLFASMTTAAWADIDKAVVDACPFKFVSQNSRTDRWNNNSQNLSTSYNELDRGVWTWHTGIWPFRESHACTVERFADDRGIGEYSSGRTTEESRMAIFGIYKCEQKVTKYTRLRMTWQYQLKQYPNPNCQTVALYAMEDLDKLKRTQVDFTEWYSGQAGKEYCICHQSNHSAKNNDYFIKDATKTFVFDNSTSGKEQKKAWYIMLTDVIGDKDSHNNFWAAACFKHIKVTLQANPCKVITYDGNGGVTKSNQKEQKQIIETSGKLNDNPFTRDGYAFVGWNTKTDGSGEYYSNLDALTVTDADKGELKLYAQWISKPQIIDAGKAFSQKGKQVVLKWKVEGGKTSSCKFIIYRNGTYLATVNHTFVNVEEDISYVDQNNGSYTDFPYESNVKYDVYLVLNNWNEATKNSNYMSSATVNTTRTMPINNFEAACQTDRIQLTWNSDGYPASQNHQFKVFVDNTLAYTITPDDNQTDFQWEHRDATGGQSGKEGTIYYTNANLNGTNTHDYRVESYIDGKKFSVGNADKKAIGETTTFSSFNASKNAYTSSVKLSWHINRDGSTKTQTYKVERRDAKDAKENWVELYNTSSKQEYLSYIDDTPEPGIYYEYMITMVDTNASNTAVYHEARDIGFSKTSGTITGRISYGASGTAVANVEVVAEQLDSVENKEQYNAVQFTSTNATLTWDYPSVAYATETFSTAPFSIQFWVDPESIGSSKMVSLNGNTCYIGMDADGHPIWVNDGQTYSFDQLTFVAGQYHHLAFTRDGNTLTAYLISDNQVVTSQQQTLSGNLNMTGATQFVIGGFAGYVDEFRIWSKALTTKDIRGNYDCLLGGNETGLVAYWPFDEGLSTIVIDFSRVNTDYNSHHGKVGNNVQFSPVHTPSSLKLKTITDQYGNYILRCVPFAGEGTTYSIIPALGIHSFNPQQQLRYVSLNSLVHNGIDFNDVSAFPVSGKVCYAGTSIPVEGCNLYVDGEACTIDGEQIQTDANGQFEISVPIGDHSIQIKKDGHVFAYKGRYPADPKGTGEKHTFDREVRDLTFTDSTLVNFTGRVVGGDIEGNKSVGFGLSKNNIGKAKLTLHPDNIGSRALNIENHVDSVPSATDKIASHAWRGAGSTEESQKLYIITDSLTGEFSALVPPLNYIVERIYVDSADLDLLDCAIGLDMTDAQITYADSVKNDGLTDYYTYHTKLCQIYHVDVPSFSVKQQGHDDGSFGIDTFLIEDALGTLKVDNIHYVENDEVKYAFGYPLFRMMDPYVFEMAGYEVYVNKDGAEDIMDTVPLANVEVIVENALSAGTSLFSKDTLDIKAGSVANQQSDQFRLDSLGQATYTWYGGLPNILGDQSYARNIYVYYYINNRYYLWQNKPITGILLGDFPMGNNFVTKGPDMVEMILRDPPGSQSFATWEKGIIAKTIKLTATYESKGSSSNCNPSLMPTFNIAGNGLSGTISFGVQGYDEYANSDEWVNSNTIVTTRSVTEAISTSDSPDYDGADGDVFIGTATNLIFGDTKKVSLYRDPQDALKASIQMKDAIATSIPFETEFAYSQREIEHDQIPKWERIRNSLLQTVADTSQLLVNETDSCIYVTELTKGDPNYGADGTYKMIVPSGKERELFFDTIHYYNQQIALWKHYLALNEKEKVEAEENRLQLIDKGKLTNHSFDAGVIKAYTCIWDTIVNQRKDTIHTWSCITSAGGGMSVFGIGGKYTGVTMEGGGNSTTSETSEENSVAFSYTLKDTDTDDAITVDVFHDQGLYGSPIFRTQSGQTRNPYEGEVKTRYYEPGEHVIMEATQAIERPDIDVAAPIAIDIPSGSAANFTLKMANLSDVASTTTFRLYVADKTNSQGAQLIMDGMPLTGEGRTIRLSTGESVSKLLQLRQSKMSVMDYEQIAIVLSSVYQSSIADTVWISAHFVPSASPVALALSTNTINIQTDTTLTLTMSDFNRTYEGQKAFRLQYQKQGDIAWTTFHEYVLNQADSVSGYQSLLPATGAAVAYKISLKNYADGEYRFRIVSVSTYGMEEIQVFSNEQTVVKDTSRPRPLGQAEPADGVLEIGDELSITYNTPFLSGELSADNFRVTGVLNGAEVEHYTALRANEGIKKPAAQTEASINLSGKDYSLDAWFNIASAGTLLIHGSGKQKMTVGTNETGQLVVTIADSVYTSTQVLPRNKWLFFSLSRKAAGSNGTMNIAVAYDDMTEKLFVDKEVPLYYGNGPISAGCGADAAIHELLLWDEARDIQTALSQRAVTKKPSTRHLIGYWKMNEGEGKAIRDYARNRHMVMPGETWYLNNINKAIILEDSVHLVIPIIGNERPLPDDDYAVGFWMCCGVQADTVSLMHLGQVAMRMDKTGKLLLMSKGTEVGTADAKLSDKQWHHVLLNVRRRGTAAVYIDGIRALTVSASTIGSFDSPNLLMGEKYQGKLDEIRIWNATMSSDMIASKRKIRLTGQEPGLGLYYPFEEKSTDSYGQPVTLGSAKEMTIHQGDDAVLSNGEPLTFTDDAPALREKPTQSNVKFSFTASDTKIVINLDEAEAADIDGCTLNFTVDKVRSANGNYSQPATWSAFVHRNELVWQDNELTAVQEKNTSTTLTTAIINRSGTPQRWSLGDLPSWLTASSTSGMLDPMEATSISFTVNEATPIGKYERSIYLIGYNNVETPLTLHLTVKGDIPDWTVKKDNYPYSMDIIARLKIFGETSDDPDDIVAAFIGDECRGVAHPEYKERYDGYYLTLSVYGNAGNIDKKELTFRAYDASTGITYAQALPDTTIVYEALSLVGRYDDPVILNVENVIEQHLVLNKGWNWITLNVKMDDMTPISVFNNVASDVLMIKGQSMTEGFLQHDSLGHWYGNMDTLRNNKMYKVLMHNERDLRLIGQRVSPQKCKVKVEPKWNWIGYYQQQRMTVADALAPMAPQDSDILRSQKAICYFDDYEWVGSLHYMEPGQGYTIYNSTKLEKSFAYPASSINTGSQVRSYIPAAVAAKTENIFTPVSATAYPFNMILIAHVHDSGKPIANSELGVFAGSECRAAGMTDDDGFITMMIPGEDPVKLTFKVVDNGEVREADEKLDYETDAIVGSYTYPFEIEFGEHTGIDDILDGDTRTVKILRNGILYILRNGRIFNAQGIEVK